MTAQASGKNIAGDRTPAVGAHTPGPWSQSRREQPDGMFITQVYDADGGTIADLAWHAVKIGDGVATDHDANARLIAAAPDMLTALKMLDEVLDFSDQDGGFQMIEDVSVLVPAMKEALAAIAKAEGR